MLLKDKQVAIIGGGPGGLTLARLLQLKGVHVKVYERDINEAARVQGATLDLHYESGLKALKKAGLITAFQKAYRPGAGKGRVMDKDANILFDEHDNAGRDDVNSEDARPEIDRGPLRDLLLSSLEHSTVVWNAHFDNMSPLKQGWQLNFKNGMIAYADLVIGADGANSKIRSLLSSAENKYVGTIILQGNVSLYPEIEKVLAGGKIYIYADEKFLHISAKGDGSVDFYLSIKKNADWGQTSGINFLDHTSITDWFKDEFTGWNILWQGLVEKANLPLLIRPQYCMPLEQSWESKTNVTLLGDAAHLMPPSGEGVNLAMLDALDLSKTLTGDNYPDIKTAIKAYEKQMWPRAAAEARSSLDMVQWMHGENASTKFIQLFMEQ